MCVRNFNPTHRKEFSAIASDKSRSANRNDRRPRTKETINPPLLLQFWIIWSAEELISQKYRLRSFSEHNESFLCPSAIIVALGVARLPQTAFQSRICGFASANRPDRISVWLGSLFFTNSSGREINGPGKTRDGQPVSFDAAITRRGGTRRKGNADIIR